MNIKIQCSCGTKFSFDVEPIDGRMPVEIFCPKCGADGTEYANHIIQQELSSESAPAAAPAIQKPRVRLQVAHQPAPSVSGGEATSAESAPAGEMCHRHVRNLAVEHCVVCKKPICPECMQAFGYLCSVNCRYRAEQEKIRVPKYKFQRNAVERGALRKSMAITSAVLCVVLGLIGMWFWYILSGSKPSTFYSLKVPANRHGTHAQFLGPNQILLLAKNKISLHDIKSKKDIWSTALDDPKPAPVPEPAPANATKRPVEIDDEDYYDKYSSIESAPFFKGDDVWLCLSHNVLRIDLKTGAVKQTVAFQGRLSAFTPGESMLLVVSEKVPTRKIVTQINLDSGEAKTTEVASSLREKIPLSKDLPSSVAPTAAALLRNELEAQQKNRPSIYKFSSEFFPAGQNMVEMQVKLVEPKVTYVQTMKPAGPSKLNSGTSAASDVRAVAEDLFNEMKRNDGGGVREVDESRYNVLLRRTVEEGATDWTGEVTGLPEFFPQKTVDVLVGGTNLFLFDKQNKNIAKSQLRFPIAEDVVPCIEAGGMLFFFDAGVLTAFDLPSGEVRWRLTSVGISEIQFDSKGMLYVSTTTGTPEDIQYSEQIKLNDAAQNIILKVDPQSGKTLWKCEKPGSGCFLTGKYLYITEVSRGGFAMINAVEEAFSARSSATGNFNMLRINPANGKKMWSFNKKGVPENIDFSENRILLHYGNEIQVLKYLSF